MHPLTTLMCYKGWGLSLSIEASYRCAIVIYLLDAEVKFYSIYWTLSLSKILCCQLVADYRVVIISVIFLHKKKLLWNNSFLTASDMGFFCRKSSNGDLGKNNKLFNCFFRDLIWVWSNSRVNFTPEIISFYSW